MLVYLVGKTQKCYFTGAWGLWNIPRGRYRCPWQKMIFPLVHDKNIFGTSALKCLNLKIASLFTSLSISRTIANIPPRHFETQDLRTHFPANSQQTVIPMLQIIRMERPKFAICILTWMDMCWVLHIHDEDFEFYCAN